MKFKKTVTAYRCERCNHEWVPRGKLEPKICPDCKTSYWDRPRLARRRSPVGGAGGADG